MTFLTVVDQSSRTLARNWPVWFNCSCQIRLCILQYMAVV